MENKQYIFYSMLGVFVAWLVLIFAYLLPQALANPANIDPMMALLTGLGIGGITQFFITLLTLAWQYYFRKRPAVPEK